MKIRIEFKLKISLKMMIRNNLLSGRQFWIVHQEHKLELVIKNLELVQISLFMISRIITFTRKNYEIIMEGTI